MLNKNIINEFNLDKNYSEVLNDWQNTVYKCKNKNGELVVIRVAPESHRTFQQIESEIEIILNALKYNIPVPEPILANNKKHIVTFESNSTQFNAVCFKWIDKPLMQFENNSDNKNIKLFNIIGQNMAKINNSMDKIYLEKTISRMQWFEEPLFINISDYQKLIPSDVLVSINKIFEKIKRISTENMDYGLIHNDLRVHNIFEKDYEINIIDFDQSCYNFRAKELANFIFASFIHPRICVQDSQKHLLDNAIKEFIDGYNKFRKFPKEQMNYFNLFIKERIILAYLCELSFTQKAKSEKAKKEIKNEAKKLELLLLTPEEKILNF